MLLHIAAYQGGNKIADIENISDIGAYTGRQDCFVWVALKDAQAEEVGQLQRQFNLHELSVEDALVGHERPKIEEYEDALFAVVHTAEIVDGGVDAGEAHIFIGKNYAISMARGGGQGFQDVRERCEQEPGQLRKGPCFVLYALLDAVVDRYFPVIEEMEARLEKLEERIFTKGAQRSNIQRLYELKRRVMKLRHAVAPLTEAIGKLHGGRVPPACVGTQAYFRDVSDHLIRINATIDTMRDTISTAIQVNLSMVTMDESDVTKRLAAWAAIFAIATALAGIWGMNFKYMPELNWKFGYPAALFSMAAVCAYLYYRFRKAGWL
jgi:magnesium transporter